MSSSPFKNQVGMTGLEPATTRPQTCTLPPELPPENQGINLE